MRVESSCPWWWHQDWNRHRAGDVFHEGRSTLIFQLILWQARRLSLPFPHASYQSVVKQVVLKLGHAGHLGFGSFKLQAFSITRNWDSLCGRHIQCLCMWCVSAMVYDESHSMGVFPSPSIGNKCVGCRVSELNSGKAKKAPLTWEDSLCGSPTKCILFKAVHFGESSWWLIP